MRRTSGQSHSISPSLSSRTPVRRWYIENLTVTPRNVETAVLLLRSPESEVLWPTLRALTKFAAKGTENAQMIFDFNDKWNATNNIARHIESRDLVVKRYALKLLSILAKVPGVPEYILSNPCNMKIICSIRVEDVYCLEFATLLVSILTRSLAGCEQFLIINIWNRLFNRMKTATDPDILYNILQIFFNILQIQECAVKFLKNPSFSWSTILSLLQNKYCNIQLTTLDIIQKITTMFDNVAAQNSFRHSTGIEDLLDVLDMYEFRDIHIQTLAVIHAYIGTTENINHFHKKQGIERLLGYLHVAPPCMKSHILAILAKISSDRSGRVALFELEGDLEFCNHLTSSDSDGLSEAATGVTNMTKLFPSAIRMSDTQVVRRLCAILEDETLRWYNVRFYSLKALTDLCRTIPKNACSLIQPKPFAALQQTYNVEYDDVPIGAQRLAMQCCLNLQSFSDSIKAFMNPKFICDVLNVLMKRADIHLKVLTCQVLMGLMVNEECKDYFMTYNGPKAIHENLKVDHRGFRTALCNLIAASVTDESADMYVELGTIHYMLQNKCSVKSWDAALDKIFQCHPSAKFAYTGRLEINDITRDGFYVMKKLQTPFPTLSQIKSSSPPYEHPVYICRFRQPPSKRHSSVDVVSPYQLIKILDSFPEATMCECENSDPCTPASDTYDDTLRKYLTDLILTFDDRDSKHYHGTNKSWHFADLEEYEYLIRSRDTCREVSTTLKQKAQFLAEYVVDRQARPACGVAGMDVHLRMIMKARNTPILSIGVVKNGGQLERSVLYKALADRLGLPCSLHRARGGHSWCEVAVPEADTDEQPEGSVYPHGLLRSNYVVDLICPRLLLKGSYEARRYCGPVKSYATVMGLDKYAYTTEGNKENSFCSCKKL